MEKQIVTIDVGSEIVYHKCSYPSIVKSIDLSKKYVYFTDNDEENFNFLTSMNLKMGVYSINNIPVSEISEVRIAGYNDKVTLQIGDILTNNDKYIDDLLFKIIAFNKDKIFRKSANVCLAMSDVWYVNGIEYDAKNITIPTANFSRLKVGQWIKSLVDIRVRLKDKWYQVTNVSDDRSSISYATDRNTGVYSKTPSTWDLIDVRDEDPNIAKEDKEMEFEPLTSENFHKLLIHNHYHLFSKDSNNVSTYKNDNREIRISSIDDHTRPTYVAKISGCFHLETYFWNDVVDIIIPRFELKQVPVFHPGKYLLDNGCKSHPLSDITYTGEEFMNASAWIEHPLGQEKEFLLKSVIPSLTKHNTEIALKIMKLSQEFKKDEG